MRHSIKYSLFCFILLSVFTTQTLRAEDPFHPEFSVYHNSTGAYSWPAVPQGTSQLISLKANSAVGDFKSSYHPGHVSLTWTISDTGPVSSVTFNSAVTPVAASRKYTGTFKGRFVGKGKGVGPPPIWMIAGDQTVGGVEITASGDHIVPGSTKNRVEYKISPSDFTADSGELEVFKSSDMSNAIRTIVLTETQLQGGSRFVEWDGKDSDSNALTEDDSPYTYKITLTKGTYFSCDDEQDNRKVEEWIIATIIGDKPADSETLVTGIDESTIIISTYEVKVNFYDEGETPETIGAYDIDENQESPDGPSDNEWDAHVWLKKDETNDFIFYTTPSSPNNIKYEVQLESKGDMVLDGVLNKWDMNEDTTDFETKGTWVFGVEPEGSEEDFREFTEVYEEVE